MLEVYSGILKDILLDLARFQEDLLNDFTLYRLVWSIALAYKPNRTDVQPMFEDKNIITVLFDASLFHLFFKTLVRNLVMRKNIITSTTFFRFRPHHNEFQYFHYTNFFMGYQAGRSSLLYKVGTGALVNSHP